MNLVKLFATQTVLDTHIVKGKGLRGHDLLSEKFLALLTELGELSNEWQGFKFWKEDREPRTLCPHCKGTGHCHYTGFANPTEPCSECNGYPHTKNPLLEEYVDCLHFILSLGLELHPKVGYMEWAKGIERCVDETEITNSRVITDTFNLLFKRVIVFAGTQELSDYAMLFYLFLTLGRRLNFTLDQIETAYYHKNEINHERQNSNY